MNTKDFMKATGIPSQQMVSYYIKRKIINPIKVGKEYNFTKVDVKQVLVFKTGQPNLQPPVLTYDLSQVSTPQIIEEYHKRVGL